MGITLPRGGPSAGSPRDFSRTKNMSAAQKRCYYEVLGVTREASSDELRKAYKQAAIRFHPDRNPDDPSAESKFKEANEAFQVLSDDSKRRIYDQFGHAGLEGGGIDFGAG